MRLQLDGESMEDAVREARDKPTEYLEGYVTCYERTGSRLTRFFLGNDMTATAYKRVLEERRK